RERGYYEKISAIEKIDDYTVVAKFKEPYFNELVLLSGLYVMPRHFYGKYSPEDYNRIPGLMMGTGPYRMESPTDWTPGKPLILVRNDRYWGIPSGFDRIVFKEL